MNHKRSLCFVTLIFSLSGGFNLFGQDEDISPLDLTVIRNDVHKVPPAWAIAQRHLIEVLNQAGVIFHDTYVQEDGTMRFKERYEGGMNSLDDIYEAFRGFSLHTALGGSYELDRLQRNVWEGITRQFRRYGLIYNDFSSTWDWMHHGEGYVALYPMGLVEPHDAEFKELSIRFAAMYTGDDPEAQNYDPELRLMRASMNGSRGPKMEWTKRDWIPTNANLVAYPLPYPPDLVPGLNTPLIWINDHPDNDLFEKHIKLMSDRMAKGDIPINLHSVPLIANAYLYTGDPHYVQWVKDYVGKWEELTERNNGITPDNVGLSDKIGEYTGNWWGGYYGWMWPRGGFDIIMAQLASAKAATLLTGDTRWANLPRSQMALLRGEGELRDGVYFVPTRHDERGWHQFIREPAYPYLQMWFISQDEIDWQELERLAEAEIRTAGSLRTADLKWGYQVRGKMPDFGEYARRIFEESIAEVVRRLEPILGEQGDPETWPDNKWLALNPVNVDTSVASLVQLSLGGLHVHRRGEMLHSQVRYFDGVRQRAGLPPDVAAIVTRIESEWIEVEVVNLSVFETRQLIIQAGAYGEHRFRSVAYQQGAVESNVRLDAPAFAVDLAPGSGSTLKIQIERYVNQSSYAHPWSH